MEKEKNEIPDSACKLKTYMKYDKLREKMELYRKFPHKIPKAEKERRDRISKRLGPILKKLAREDAEEMDNNS